MRSKVVSPDTHTVVGGTVKYRVYRTWGKIRKNRRYIEKGVRKCMSFI